VRGRTLILLGALGWGGIYLGSMLAATGGHLSMPLDDAYIFFQYARRLAEAGVLSYQPGAPPNGGATSLLTVAVDALGYLAGFRGAAMSVFAILLGTAALAWSGVSAWALGRRLCPAAAWAPPLLLFLTGPVLWGMMSGMDLPVVVALSLAFVAAWPRPGELPPWRLYVLGALLGLGRPDAVFLTLPAFLFGLGFPGRRKGWILPLAATAFPFALQTLLTGSPESASMDVKSVLANPGFTFGEWWVGGLAYLQTAIKGVFGGAALGDAAQVSANNGSGIAFYLVPFALALTLLGLVPGAWLEGRKRRPGPHLLLLAWITLLLAAVSFTVPRTWHWHRYLMPIEALAAVAIAAGAVRVGRGLELLWKDLAPDDGPRMAGVVVAVLSLPAALYFPVAYGRDSSDIYFQHIQLAHRLNESSPVLPDLLGLHDAGALAYFGRYRVLDLEGLVSPTFRKPARLGAAGVWEALERMPPQERPDVLAFYPNWFDRTFLSPHRLVAAQRVFRPSIVAGNPLNVYLADWSLAGRGDLPRDPAVLHFLGDRILMADVDVADLVSERAADYRFGILDGAYQTSLQRLAGGDGREIMEGGRIVSGWEAFTIRGTHARDELVLVGRFNGPFRIRVETNGSPRGIWMQDAGKSGAWQESRFVIPLGPDAGSSVRIRLSSDDPHHAAYGSFHYWVYRS